MKKEERREQRFRESALPARAYTEAGSTNKAAHKEEYSCARFFETS